MKGETTVRFVPDRIFEQMSDITPAVVSSARIRGLVLDIDYTLAPRDVPLPDSGIIRCLGELNRAGVKLYIISNNHRGRVSRFAGALGVPFTCNGMKPLPAAFRRAVRQMGLLPHEVAAVGDQIYTDVFGAHLAGLQAWMVRPVGVSCSVFYRFRRWLERPFVNRFYRAGRG